MKADIRQRWIDELRSGKRQQTKRQLRSHGNRNAFCCLGVLCDLYDSRRWDGEIYDDGEGGKSGMPPADVLNETGLTWDEANTLAALNDDGHNFAVIANVIERDIAAA